uniref:Ribosomal RNA-processing protein 42 n=2 Tax=Quercus TaxID=3511 RepID=A0A7N2KTV2_QUELO
MVENLKEISKSKEQAKQDQEASNYSPLEESPEFEDVQEVTSSGRREHKDEDTDQSEEDLNAGVNYNSLNRSPTLQSQQYGCAWIELGMVGLSLGEKHFIQGGIAQDIRSDGRKRLTYRPINVETGVIPQANGSARIRMGATDVISTVKAELGKPISLQPDKGKVSIYVDCSPTAAPMFEGRGGEELSTELSVALQRSLLGGKSGAGAGIDLSSLVVVEGKICWDLYIDCLVVCSDGNLLDALGAAIKAALSNTGIPRVQVAAGASGDEQPEVDISDEEFLQFDTSDIPVIVTLTKVGRHYIVDATTEEESQMSSAISISVNRKGHICGLTKRGGAGLDPSIVLDMISVAKHVSEQLMNKLDSEIAAAEAGEDES